MKKQIEDRIENKFDPFKLLIKSGTEGDVDSYKKLADYYLAQVGNPKLKILGIHFLRKVVEHEPENPKNYLKLARLEYASGYVDKALSLCDQALALKPDSLAIHFHKLIFQISPLPQKREDISYSRDNYQAYLIELKERVNNYSEDKLAEGFSAVIKLVPFFLTYQGRNDKELMQVYGEIVDQIVSARFSKFSSSLPISRPTQNQRIRVGIPFSFSVLHTIWKVVLHGWLQQLNRDDFELYGYALKDDPNARSDEVRAYFDEFVDHPTSLESWAAAILQDDLHIILYPTVSLDTTTQALASLCLAPVQCTSLGHFTTTGLPKIDYFLSSDLAEPANGQEHYTEKLVRLPNLGIYYAPREGLDISRVSRDQLGLNSSAVIYNCAQSCIKYQPQYDKIFPIIAKKVNNCQFLFRKDHQSDTLTLLFQARLSNAFKYCGLEMNDYVVWLEKLPNEEFYAAYALSDIFLEPISTGGFSTVLDSIDYDLPVIAYKGEFLRNRGGYAILTRMGLQATIATNLDEYLEIAVDLGNNPIKRQALSKKIAANKHKIYHDTEAIEGLARFVKNIFV